MLPISAKDVTFIITNIDRISNSRSPLYIPLYPDPVPIHILKTIYPKPKLACQLAIVVIFTSPQHQVLLIQVDEASHLLRWPCICNNFLNPNVRLGIHGTIDEFELVEIIE